MTSVSLNLPAPTLQDQTQLFISPNNHQSSLSYCSFFDILDQSQAKDIRYLTHGDQEVRSYILFILIISFLT